METATLAQVACVVGPKLMLGPGPIGPKLMSGPGPVGPKLMSGPGPIGPKLMYTAFH